MVVMKVVFATGIYPPDIGGPATYVHRIAAAFHERKIAVKVIAYGETGNETEPLPVFRVSRRGGPVMRWWRYAKMLREVAKDADIIYAFSSVSCGVPLWLAHLKGPHKVLRLGGDFFWERYTDGGGTRSLKEWYDDEPWLNGFMSGMLKHYNHIVFSSAFQEDLYEKYYHMLPLHSVIENALPQGVPIHHERHDPLRLLFLGRFVSFKNLGTLILALKELPGMTLSLVGEGPLRRPLEKLIKSEGLSDRVFVLPAVSGDGKQQVFLDHDLLVLPSLTEISPNTALEARAAGLPVLLTEETGLSRQLTDAALLRPLRSPEDIVVALREINEHYSLLADKASSPLPLRTWDMLAEEHLHLFRSFL